MTSGAAGKRPFQRIGVIINKGKGRLLTLFVAAISVNTGSCYVGLVYIKELAHLLKFL